MSLKHIIGWVLVSPFIVGLLVLLITAPLVGLFLLLC